MEFRHACSPADLHTRCPLKAVGTPAAAGTAGRHSKGRGPDEGLPVASIQSQGHPAVMSSGGPPPTVTRAVWGEELLAAQI